MSTKQLHFRIRLEAIQGNEAVIGTGGITVALHGTAPFLGLSVWHEIWRERTNPYQTHRPFLVISRSAPGTNEDRYLETARYQVHTTSNPDPIVAVSRALRQHLLQRLHSWLGPGVDEAIVNDAFVQQVYGDQIVEPITTAVLAMCRDASLHAEFAHGERLWAIGTWQLQAALAEGALSTVLELGTQVQDVLVVRDDEDHAGQVQRYLIGA
jgi:hypothetical protein